MAELRLIETADAYWIEETGEVAVGWQVTHANGWSPCSDHAHATPEGADRCYRKAVPARDCARCGGPATGWLCGACAALWDQAIDLQTNPQARADLWEYVAHSRYRGPAA